MIQFVLYMCYEINKNKKEQYKTRLYSLRFPRKAKVKNFEYAIVYHLQYIMKIFTTSKKAK